MKKENKISSVVEKEFQTWSPSISNILRRCSSRYFKRLAKFLSCAISGKEFSKFDTALFTYSSLYTEIFITPNFEGLSILMPFQLNLMPYYLNSLAVLNARWQLHLEYASALVIAIYVNFISRYRHLLKYISQYLFFFCRPSILFLFRFGSSFKNS